MKKKPAINLVIVSAVSMVGICHFSQPIFSMIKKSIADGYSHSKMLSIQDLESERKVEAGASYRFLYR